MEWISAGQKSSPRTVDSRPSDVNVFVKVRPRPGFSTGKEWFSKYAACHALDRADKRNRYDLLHFFSIRTNSAMRLLFANLWLLSWPPILQLPPSSVLQAFIHLFTSNLSGARHYTVSLSCYSSWRFLPKGAFVISPALRAGIRIFG